MDWPAASILLYKTYRPAARKDGFCGRRLCAEKKISLRCGRVINPPPSGVTSPGLYQLGYIFRLSPSPYAAHCFSHCIIVSDAGHVMNYNNDWKQQNSHSFSTLCDTLFSKDRQRWMMLMQSLMWNRWIECLLSICLTDRAILAGGACVDTFVTSSLVVALKTTKTK